MVNIIKEEIEIEESLESRLRVICDFCNTTPTIINGSIRRVDKTNLTYIEPHRIYIKNNLYLAFNYSSEIYVNNLGKKIKLSELEDYRKIDPDIKMETYNLGILYVKEDKGTLLENEDDVFKYIPAECESNIVYSKEPINVDVKPVPYYEGEEENSEDEISSS